MSSFPLLSDIDITKAESTCKGARIRAALTTYRDINSGQAIITNPSWNLIVRTPFTIAQDLRTPPQPGLVGKVINPGETIFSGYNNTLNKPIQIESVEINESLTTAKSYEVKVKGYSYHREYSPKLRGPAIKASAAPDITGGKAGVINPILELDSSVEVIFPAETLKGAVVSLKAYADTCMSMDNPLVITDGDVPEEVLKDHDKWIEENLKRVWVCHEIHPSVAYLYEGVEGLEIIEQIADGELRLFVKQEIEVLICDLIVEVEAQPTALRGTQSVLCCNQVVSLMKADIDKPEELKEAQFDFFNTRDAIKTREGLTSFIEMLEYNM